MRISNLLVSCALLTAVDLHQSASATTTVHTAVMPGLVVEHAEIIGARSGSDMRGYFSVWNGSSSTLDLVSVDSSAFSSVELLQTAQEDGVTRLRAIEGGLRIPPHSELLMRPDGVQLLFRKPREPIAVGRSLAVTLRFADGSSQEVEATVYTSETPVTDHHHGEGDGSGSD